MSKKLRKILAIIMCFVMVFSACAVSASAIADSTKAISASISTDKFVDKLLKFVQKVLSPIVIPTISFDASSLTGEVTSGASGYLYGIAEDGVPSHNVTESLKISSVSAKMQNGLQHPVGEVGDVAPQLMKGTNFDYLVVYLQDIYSTWYYDWQNINAMKAAGTYDFRQYLQNTYFPLIRDSVIEMANSEYKDKLVFCIFNECDNGVWFDSDDLDAFNDGWKMTYDYVRSLAPDIPIGGPGNCGYDEGRLDYFLSFTSKNNCTPDIMIYHELNGASVYNWCNNVNSLKKLEIKYGIDPDTPIIVTEYGRMEDNGDPAMMLRYITQIENSKVYANQAFWLLADNLCNTCADYNTPNSAWWVYRWYAQLEGQTMAYKISDIMCNDFISSVKQHRKPLYDQFLGLGTLSDDKDSIQLLVTGADYSFGGKVKVSNLKSTELYGKNVKITVSRMTFQGISGKVYAPETVKAYTQRCFGNITVDLSGMSSDCAYKIDISPCANTEKKYVNDNLYSRYEFEYGTLLSNAYTYDSAYATTGDRYGMVGGMEQDGDAVELTFKVPQDGLYELCFIYGNANDGSAPNDRTFAATNFFIDSNEETLYLENTIKSELTSSFVKTAVLSKGTHKVRFTHNTGTIVLDSMLVRRAQNDCIYFEKDNTENNRYLVISPFDGYCDLSTSFSSTLIIDGAPSQTDENGTATAYLRRGLNYIDLPDGNEITSISTVAAETQAESIVLNAADAVLSGDACVEKSEAADKTYITGISSNGGAAQFTVDVDADAVYKLTICYSNNLENGVHSYNVDLVESYVTISVDAAKQENLYCRNTYSLDTFTTVTTNVALHEGKNTLTFTNDGSNLFNGNAAYAPNISQITISKSVLP